MATDILEGWEQLIDWESATDEAVTPPDYMSSDMAGVQPSILFQDDAISHILGTDDLLALSPESLDLYTEEKPVEAPNFMLAPNFNDMPVLNSSRTFYEPSMASTFGSPAYTSSIPYPKSTYHNGWSNTATWSQPQPGLTTFPGNNWYLTQEFGRPPLSNLARGAQNYGYMDLPLRPAIQAKVEIPQQRPLAIRLAQRNTKPAPRPDLAIAPGSFHTLQWSHGTGTQIQKPLRRATQRDQFRRTPVSKPSNRAPKGASGKKKPNGIPEECFYVLALQTAHSEDKIDRKRNKQPCLRCQAQKKKVCRGTLRKQSRVADSTV